MYSASLEGVSHKAQMTNLRAPSSSTTVRLIQRYNAVAVLGITLSMQPATIAIPASVLSF